MENMVRKLINFKGTPTYLPIVIMHQSISKTLLAALYKTADICLVTSLRDGMNLVALEYMFTKSKCGDGMLIISEFAGVARLLRSASVVNPWSVEEVVEAIHKNVSNASGKRNGLIEDVSKYSAQIWANSFIGELTACQLQKSAQHTT